MAQFGQPDVRGFVPSLEILRPMVKQGFAMVSLIYPQITEEQFDELRRAITVEEVSAKHVKLGSECEKEKDMTVARLRKQFSAKYEDPLGVVNHFCNYLKDCIELYHNKKDLFMAPYISLVQSSGYGKSRLLRETARQLKTMYVCMRPLKWTGFPLRTEDAINILINSTIDENDKKYMPELQSEMDAVEKRVALFVLRRLPVPGDEEGTDSSQFPSEREDRNVWELRSIDPNTYKSDPQIVILVIDEALALLECKVGDISDFRLLRRALGKVAEFHESSKILAVFTDTSSSISYFSPSTIRDPSARPAALASEMLDRQLLAPYILRRTFDAGFLKLSEDADLSLLVESTEFLKAGRPLVAWGTGSLEDQLGFLQAKISGGQGSDRDKSSDKSSEKKDTSQWKFQKSLSYMLCRLGVYVFPQHRIASQVVAENMATLLATDNRRKGVLVTYVSEPKLAMAAAVRWSNTSDFVLELVPALHRALDIGISPGPRGEIVAQIIILLAFDAACIAKGVKRGYCVSIEDLLFQLVPHDFNPDDLKRVVPTHLAGTMVACCQFVNLSHKLGRRVIVEMAERHCGVVFREGQRGVDFGVPIMLNGKGTLAMLLGQVNNYSKQARGEFANVVCKKMLPTNAFSDDLFSHEQLSNFDKNCVRLMMQVGAPQTLAAVGEEVQGISPALEIYGVCSRCLSQEVIDALSVLLDGRYDLESFVEASEEEQQLLVSENMESMRTSWPFVIDRA